jgi:hypothetical protein
MNVLDASMDSLQNYDSCTAGIELQYGIAAANGLKLTYGQFRSLGALE